MRSPVVDVKGERILVKGISQDQRIKIPMEAIKSKKISVKAISQVQRIRFPGCCWKVVLANICRKVVEMLLKEFERCRDVEIWRFGNNGDESVGGEDGEEGRHGFGLWRGRTNRTRMRTMVMRANGSENLGGLCAIGTEISHDVDLKMDELKKSNGES